MLAHAFSDVQQNLNCKVPLDLAIKVKTNKSNGRNTKIFARVSPSVDDLSYRRTRRRTVQHIQFVVAIVTERIFLEDR